MNAYISWEVHKQLSDNLLRANARVAELEDTGYTLRARLVEVKAELAKAREERDAFAKEAGTAWDICEERRQEAIGYFAELAKAREALTPSAETKAAYMGEFSFDLAYMNDAGNEMTESVVVPWTTIKEIMKAISARAAMTGGSYT